MYTRLAHCVAPRFPPRLSGSSGRMYMYVYYEHIYIYIYTHISIYIYIYTHTIPYSNTIKCNVMYIYGSVAGRAMVHVRWPAGRIQTPNVEFLRLDACRGSRNSALCGQL